VSPGFPIHGFVNRKTLIVICCTASAMHDTKHALERGHEINRHTIALSSSYKTGLGPVGRVLLSGMDVSEGVVSLELPLEALLEGAISPNQRGIKLST